MRTYTPELALRNVTYRGGWRHQRTSQMGHGCLAELAKGNEKDYYHPILSLLMIDCVRAGVQVDEMYNLAVAPRERSEGLWNQLQYLEDEVLGHFREPILLPTLEGEERTVQLGMMAAFVMGKAEVSIKLTPIEKLALLQILRNSVLVLENSTDGRKVDRKATAKAMTFIEKIEEEIRDDVCVKP